LQYGPGHSRLDIVKLYPGSLGWVGLSAIAHSIVCQSSMVQSGKQVTRCRKNRSSYLVGTRGGFIPVFRFKKPISDREERVFERYE